MFIDAGRMCFYELQQVTTTASVQCKPIDQFGHTLFQQTILTRSAHSSAEEGSWFCRHVEPLYEPMTCNAASCMCSSEVFRAASTQVQAIRVLLEVMKKHLEIIGKGNERFGCAAEPPKVSLKGVSKPLSSRPLVV